ncbi:MAG: histidinol dehydrogenase, partial [Candidatus Methanospirareceae archaeon]
VIDVGLPAGPSESIILADAHANPRIVAHDLLIEAEHGSDSASLLITDSKELASTVSSILPKMIEGLPETRREFCERVFSNFGGIVITKDLEEAIDFINDYAPEHIEILVKDPFEVLPRIKNAGEILLGYYTPISASNYVLGTNAILPTGGFAKTYSATSVFDFVKRSYVAYLTKEGFERIKDDIKVLAKYEGFAAHASAIEAREI